MNSYYNRIQQVLAEVCNYFEVNGISSWDPTDFYASAKSFVVHMHTISILREAIGITTLEQAEADMQQNLDWDIPDAVRDECIAACLDELHDEMLGDG